MLIASPHTAPAFNRPLSQGEEAPARRDQARPNTFGGAADPNKVQPDREAHKNPSTPEYRELEQLKARDREVRQHERAHVAAGGQYVRGGASFSYEKGSDGRSYAVGGEVQIDTSPVRGDPQATLRKMEAVQRAAMAPADPSAQDRAVAAQAAQAAAQARAELQQQQAEQPQEGRGRQAADIYRAAAREDPVISSLVDVQA